MIEVQNLQIITQIVENSNSVYHKRASSFDEGRTN